MAIKKFLTVDQVAEMYSLKRATIYNKICRHEIPFIKISRSVRFDPDELQKWEKHQSAIIVNT